MEKPKNLTIIAIEGPDKVGKQTQSRLLEKRLDRSRIITPDKPLITLLREIPNKASACHSQIYQMLTPPKDGSQAPAKRWPQVFQTLQLANRLDMMSDLAAIASASRSSQFLVIFDRWHASSYTYGVPLGLDQDFLSYIRDFTWIPDVTILMRGNGFDRKGPADAYEDDGSFQSLVRKAYDDWYNKYKDVENIGIVDADMPIKDVEKQIVFFVSAILESKGWRSDA